MQLRVPSDLLTDDLLLHVGSASVDLILECQHGALVAALADVYAIQRFLTAIQISSSAQILWSESALLALRASPGQAALLCCAIQLEKPTHLMPDGKVMSVARRVSLQQTVASHLLLPNWFDAADSLVCSANERRGWHGDLYAGPGKLRPRSEFSRLANPLIRAKVTGLENEETVIQWKDSLISVIYELFENTHVHARFDYGGRRPLRDVVRAIIVRLVETSTGGNEAVIRSQRTYECLEISVVDSGIGFFGSRFGRPLSADDDLIAEWANVRVCLNAHGEDPIGGNGHRGVGLYEVLRALYFLRGAIQVRSGRTFGYRSFFPSDLRQQMEPIDSKTRPGMPRGRLLDFAAPYRPTPTGNFEVRGVAVRTLIPLRWE